MKAKILRQLRLKFNYNYSPSMNIYFVYLNGKEFQIVSRFKARKAVREALLNHGRKYYYKTLNEFK